MKTTNYHLKIWESSLLIALCITLCFGLWANTAQSSLAGELVRLHVVAQSDSEADQAVKLQVRDRVLEKLSPKLANAKTLEDAKTIISSSLPEIIRCADSTLLANGMPYKAGATLMTESFPTRQYTTFSLPAGDYNSLRITLGDGSGQNWWCVVFPPLCMTAAGDTDAFSMLSEDSSKLISGEEEGYKLKFHIIELYEKIRTALSR